MRLAIAAELNRRAMSLTSNGGNPNFYPQSQSERQQLLMGRHQQHQQFLHHTQMLQYVPESIDEQQHQHQQQQQQQQQPDLITSTSNSNNNVNNNNNVRMPIVQPPSKWVFAEPPAPMTSQVAEEEEEDNFYTAGVIPQVASIAEKVVQASPVVCVQEGGDDERDRLRQRALVDSFESKV